MSRFTNIAAYEFGAMSDLPALRGELLELCQAKSLKGTILLSPEGINLFVAGSAEAVECLLDRVRGIRGMEDIRVKFSFSDHQPFTRMLVRLKREIIAFGVEGTSPATSAEQTPRLAPAELKRWLDEGRPVTLLDTRNDYEVKLGTFEGARSLGIDHFRQFPDAVSRLPDELRDQPVVMFCTGGIRCEKAGLFMQQQGFKHVHQLEGGILGYFEDCGAAHYRGECFVFDHRVGLDPSLRETSSKVCHACQAPLTEEEQHDPRYLPGISCPHCHRTDHERMARRIEGFRCKLRALTDPLPGSVAYENRRPIHVPGSADGRILIDFLTTVFNHVDPENWREQIRQGRLQRRSGEILTEQSRLTGGDQLVLVLPGTVEPPVNPTIDWLFEDESMLVLNKPAPLPMHACGRFNLNTLQHLLRQVHQPEKPRPAHRLDANTSGVLVCARTRQVAGRLQPLFAEGKVEKVYLARVRGRPKQERWSCESPISSAPGPLGARLVDVGDGLPAHTDFRLLRVPEVGTSLIEARPLTGRTNQIRVHLWHQGLPIAGDPVYLPDGALGGSQTLHPDDPPMCLHASRLRFRHPFTGRMCEFEAPAPAWSGINAAAPAREPIITASR